MAGGKATLLHIIFQRHHLPPDEFMAKTPGAQAFILESMKIQLKAEQDRRDGVVSQEDEEGGE